MKKLCLFMTDCAREQLVLAAAAAGHPTVKLEN